MIKVSEAIAVEAINRIASTTEYPKKHVRITDIGECKRDPLDIFSDYAPIVETTDTRIEFQAHVPGMRPSQYDGEYYDRSARWSFPNSIILRTFEPRVFVHELSHAVQDYFGYISAARMAPRSSTVIEIQACVAECLITDSDISYIYANWILGGGYVMATVEMMLQNIKEIAHIVNFILNKPRVLT